MQSLNRLNLAVALREPKKVNRDPFKIPKDRVLRISTEVLAAFYQQPITIISLPHKHLSPKAGMSVRVQGVEVGEFLHPSDVHLDGVYSVKTSISQVLYVAKLYNFLSAYQCNWDLLLKFNGFHCSTYNYRPPGFVWRPVEVPELLENVSITTYSQFRKAVAEREKCNPRLRITTHRGHYEAESGKLYGAPARSLPGSQRSLSAEGRVVYWKGELAD